MLGVGVLRRGEDVARRAALDDLAIVHDADPVGHLAHDAEIVGDQQHGHVELGLELEQQVEDLRLDGHVERRGRLVGDEQVGLVGERHGDHHPLPLAAGELMRIGVEAALGVVDADLVEQVEHARSRAALSDRPRWIFSTSPICCSMVCSGLSEVIGSWKIMEIWLPRTWRSAVERQRQQVLALEADDAGRMRRRGVGEEPQDRERRHRLARARLADERHGLGLADVEGDMLHGMDDVASAAAEIDGEVFDATRVSSSGSLALGFFLAIDRP